MSIAFSEQFNFAFDFSQLGLITLHFERIMGFEGEVHEPFPQYIDHIIQHATTMKGINGSLYIFDEIIVETKTGTIVLDEIAFNTGKIIASHFSKCTGMAVFVCTAGETLEKYARELNKAGNLPEGYIADVAGSLVVETAMDRIQENFQEMAISRGFGITNRFSPGYCGWDVAEQQKLFSILPPNPCNISLTPSSLMQPIKSVSGIIGFGPGVKLKGYTCQFCEMTNCIYRDKRLEL